MSLPWDLVTAMGRAEMDLGKHSDFHEQSQAAKQQVFDNARACIPAGWIRNREGSTSRDARVSAHPGFITG